jgi:putative Mg2+ transporter-C (MgtC) family protein
MIVSAFGFMDILGTKDVVLDPSRVASQVISGIGFIGAGTILFLRQGIVRGLTTAAGLWTVAAIGLATGGGMYFAASMATALTIVILFILQPLERRFAERFREKNLKIITSSPGKSIEIVNQIFQHENLTITSYSADKAEDGYILSFSFKNLSSKELNQLINEFQADNDIQEIIWG